MLSDVDRRADRSPAARQQVVRIKIDGAGGKLRPRGDIAADTPAAKSPPPRRQTTRPALPEKVQQQSAALGNRSGALSAAAPSKQPVKERPEQIRREAWLLAQNPAAYTIQLLGVRNEKSLLEFVAGHRLDRSGQAAYYRSRFKGGVWYPLVYGAYPTVDQARQAVAELPEAIRDMSPWIRKMSAVHAEIRKAAKP